MQKKLDNMQNRFQWAKFLDIDDRNICEQEWSEKNNNNNIETTNNNERRNLTTKVLH